MNRNFGWFRQRENPNEPQASRNQIKKGFYLCSRIKAGMNSSIEIRLLSALELSLCMSWWELGQWWARQIRSYECHSYLGSRILGRGHPYMTSASALEGGVPKKQTKGTRLRELCTWQGGGGKKSEILRTSYMEAPARQMGKYLPSPQPSEMIGKTRSCSNLVHLI